MLMRAHRPYGLNGQRVPASFQLSVPMLAFQPQVHEFALPPGEVGSDSPLSVVRPARRLDVVVSGAKHPAPASTRLDIQVSTIPVGGRSQLGAVEPVTFGPECDIPSGACLWRAVGDPHVQSHHPTSKVGIVVVATESGQAELSI